MIKNSPISPNSTRANPIKPLGGLALGLTLGCASLAGAQNAPISVAPVANSGMTVAAEAAAPVSANISVLIVALDDLGAPNAGMVPLISPPTVPRAAPPVIAPADGMPPLVTPTGFNAPLWQWRASAAKKTKEEKKREKEAEDAKIFNVIPDPLTPYTPPGRAANPLTDNLPAPGTRQAPIVRAPGAGLFGDPLAPQTAPDISAPGRSQLMAVPLRRILVAQGYKDVQVVTPASNAIVRAIGESRLSPRVLDELKRSLATLAANNAAGVPADVSATIAAGRAASRIGQATGYRAVVGFYVADPTLVNLVGATATPDAKTQKIAVNMVVADAQRESVEPLQFIETGDTEDVWRETGAGAGAKMLDETLKDWPANSSGNRDKLAQVHFDTARAAYEGGDLPRAQDELNQSLALDPTRPDAFLLRGDILNAIDPGNGFTAYQKAVELNSTNGQDWARIATAYANANANTKTPDWGPAWEAGKRALSLNYDSAALRVTLATIQYGRADLFRKAQYPNQADEAEADARTNLERALQLAPDDPTAVRLLSRNLINKRRYEEAARTLDRIAPNYPKDLEIQSQYALALGSQTGREEDAFAAYARVWKLSGLTRVTVDAALYRTLASGFDQRLFNLGRLAIQLARGVESRAVLRETALIQMTKLKEEMDTAKDAINIMQPSAAIGATTTNSRVFAANLMDQSLEALQTYLDTGQADYFQTGDGLYRQAVAQLNTARGGQ